MSEVSERLALVDPASPGCSRRRRGRGWSFYDCAGVPIADPDEIDRITSLVIPPAWQDVWICPDPEGHIQAVGTDAAVKELIGDQYSCKDLRTWNATVLAAVTVAAVARGGVPEKERTRKRVVNRAIKEVATHLGNTPTVARSSYVDPRVIERFDEGRTVLGALKGLANGSSVPDLTDDATRAAVERSVVRLIAS